MQKFLVTLAAMALLGGACAADSSTVTTSPGGGSSSPAGNACDKASLNLVEPGTLTIATDDPGFLFPPWILKHDPTSGKGYESAVAYEVAKRLGFTPHEVKWVTVPFNKSYAPGPKDFDFDINQISVTPDREKAVTFSGSYYDVSQALVATEGTPIASATTLAELKDYKFGAQVGTTSLDFINTVIQPTRQSFVYDTTNDAKSALNARQVDGLVLDLPTAAYVSAVQIPGSTLVGQFESTGEHFGMLFEKDNPLATCVNSVLDDMRSAGTLDDYAKKYLSDYLGVPTIT